MRRVLLTTVLLGVMFTVSACSGNKDVVSDDSSKLLDKPEVTQAATKEKESGSSDSDNDSEDRYKKIQFGEDELFFPNIALFPTHSSLERSGEDQENSRQNPS